MKLNLRQFFKQYGVLILWLLVYSTLVVSAVDHIFFWDTVQLASKHAHFFYEKGMNHVLLPDDIDSGHPPFFGWILAAAWRFFGKSLVVSHLMMLPWVWLMVICVYKLSEEIGDVKLAPWLASLILIDPTLMAQASLISPDVLVVAGFVLCLYGIFRGQNTAVLLGSLLCGLTSNRGAMVVVAMMIWYAWMVYAKDKKITGLVKKLTPLMPSLLIFGMFQFYHYVNKGWIGYHTASPWAPSFEWVSLGQMVKNMGLLCWRMIDFGRWPVLVVLLYLLVAFRNAIINKQRQKELLVLGLSMGVILIPSMVVHAGLTGHRYLLPLIVVIYLLVGSLLGSSIKAKVIYVLMFISLATGHWWRYPKGVAQGWDSSLAHWPYFGIWREMQNYMQQHNIPIEKVGTAFPNLAELRYLDLSNNKTKHTSRDLDKNDYFLYSNIYNEISTKDDSLLHARYMKIYSLQENGISLILYKQK